MTRLVEKDVYDIGNEMEAYDRMFGLQTGTTMLAVAKRAMNVEYLPMNRKIAVVPVTSGLGIIGGFSQALVSIFKHYELNAYATKKSDVGGILEAYEKKADMIIMADDDNFIMFNIKNNSYAENGYCTGRSFAQALYQALGEPVQSEEILVLGAGPVGSAAAIRLEELGQIPVVYDIDKEKAKALAMQLISGYQVEHMVMSQYRGIIDGTTAGGFIRVKDIRRDGIISAPGVPLGVAPEVLEKIPVIHNTLELGTLAMFCQCINMEEKEDE